VARDLPCAIKYLSNSIDSCLPFFMCPKEEWVSLRTTNIIDRLNKEFNRRAKPMEIVAGENACYMLLAFVSIKMELHWRSNLIGKVHNNLPFLQNWRSKNLHKIVDSTKAIKAWPVRHRQMKGAETDMLHLKPPERALYATLIFPQPYLY